MTKLSVTPFLILLMVLVPAATAGIIVPRRRSLPITTRQMVRYLMRKMPHHVNGVENWTVRPRSPSDLRIPMTKDMNKLKLQCWTYFGHPQTIRDVNAFFKWGCQPYPNTCEGLNKLPKQCLGTMFSSIKNARPRQVMNLYGRCNMKVRPIDKKTRKYVSYCHDMVRVVQAKITQLAKQRRPNLF